MDTRSNITDDPRLTAYALGELKGTERDEIERLIARSPAAKAEVEAIRQMAGALTYELAGELPPEIHAAAPVARARIARSEDGSDVSGSHARSQLRRRLKLAALATTVASIAVVLAVASRRDFARSQWQARLSDEIVTQPVEGKQASESASVPSSADIEQRRAAHVAQFNTLAEEKKAERFVHAMESVEESSVPFDDRTASPVPDMAGASNRQSPHSVEPAGDFVAAQQAVQPTAAPSDAGEGRVFPHAAGGYPITSPAASPNYPITVSAATGGAPTPTGVGVQGVAPAYGTPGSPPVGRSAGAAPTSAQTATSCCAPCLASPPPGIGANPFSASNQPSVPYTICKPVYANNSRYMIGLTAPLVAGAGVEINRKTTETSPQPSVFFNSGGEFPISNESYSPIVENDFLSPLKEPLSTFSADVDTGSYSNTRRFLEQGQLPPADAVRIEEMLNYFSYDYAPPADGKPFAVHIETAACPWYNKHRLARIAIKGREVPRDKRPPSNLVFLVDVSGSMDEPNKLPLVKASLAMIIESLNENDRVAIVTYAGSVQRVLDSTPGNKRSQIMAAISALGAGGSTNGEGGIQMAYETAAKGFRKGGTNRIILCTDGDFNVGVSDDGQLVKLIEEKRQSGVFLSIFGFGMGNLKDAKLEKLADHGNGQYGYIDSRQEARKVFVEGLSGTLVTIAKDVKLQVEFNPAQVGAYRLVGYENRALAAEDFNNDAKDAGDIGAGHNVTALYEIVPVSEMKSGVDPLKYQGQPVATSSKAADKPASDELFTLKLRYKQPDGETSQKIEIPCKDRPDASAHPSRDFDWAAGVAAFGMLLRDSKHKGIATFDLALELAQGGKGKDAHGYRAQCIELMRKAKGLKQQPQAAAPPVP